MDEEMECRWRAGHSPFDGVILRHDELLPLPVLRRALTSVVQGLHERHGDPLLYKLHDWHEHDGYVIQPKVSSWQELHSMLSSDKALYAASTGDTYVSTAFFPPDRTFYLRIYIPDEFDLPRDSREELGKFDLTCSVTLAESTRKAAEQAGDMALLTEPAKLYFNRTYAG
jgi:hypothetical protein